MFQNGPLHTVGSGTIVYNNSKVLDGKYDCLSESRVGFDKDTIHVEVENKLVPIGAVYIHSKDYSTLDDDSGTPTVVSKMNPLPL